jgi:GntR family transcriptional regulator / MocR family aminotransferase
LEEPKKRLPRIGYRTIYEDLREAICSGIYAKHDAIPSSRGLAEELGVSRSTVNRAYEQLVAEGYIVVGPGTRPRVAADIHADRTVHQSEPVEVRSADAELSAFGRRLIDSHQRQRSRAPSLRIDFRYGSIAGEDFPLANWHRSVNAVLRRREKVLSYQDPCGSPALRQALQNYLWRARLIKCSCEQIIIVNGSQQALDLLARILLDPGDPFVIENPSYAMARNSFEAEGAKALPIEVDEHGMMTEQLGGQRARLAYVTPSHQYPLGGVMSIERRMQLLSWAKRCGAWIVEDDYDHEFRYDEKPVAPLFSFSADARVIYIGTVSKSLSPGMRIGYAVLPHALTGVFALAKQLADRHNSVLEQDALADFIQSGLYERHVRRQRRKCNLRRETLIRALKDTFGDRVEIQGTQTGLHVVIWFRDIPITQEAELIERAHTMGVGLYSIRPLCNPPLPGERNKQIGLVMGYASISLTWIVEGVALLQKVIGDLRL